MYESLTKYLDQLKEDQIGTWTDVKGEGTSENPYTMPYVDYSKNLLSFTEDIYKFVEDHPEMDLTHYRDILEENNIKFSRKPMAVEFVESLDGPTTMALIVASWRGERFSEGLLLETINSGNMEKWLRRLKKIDEEK